MRVVYAFLFSVITVSIGLSQEIFSANPPGETRNRSYHVLHYKIEVTLHDTSKSLDGRVTTTFVPLLPNFSTVVFDAGDMKIKSVTDAKGKALKYSSTPESLSIDLGQSYSPGQKATVTIAYTSSSTKGLTYNNTDLKIPGKRPQYWSQGEETTNHYWFPCYDYPNDKATVEVIGTVDAKYTFLSNGSLLSVKEDKKNKTKTFHWREDKPFSSYLVMIAAGEYTILRDNVGKLPLEFYAYPDDTTNARASFKETADMIRFFNKTIGVDYPWDKYAQIILQDHFGGMENVSATTLADGWAVPDARWRIDNPSTSLIAHELAHQWFGDLVTCRNFRDMWLNESFASYYDPLFIRSQLGEQEFEYTMFQNQASGVRVDTTRGRKPVVSVNSYGENVYPRGSAILDMLSYVLGEDSYNRAIRHYVLSHQFQPVETNDLKMAIEEETGQNLQWFFDEWLYKAGHPIFNVSYTWDEQMKAVSLKVKQTQKQDSLTGVFKMPVDVEITSPSGSVTHRIGIVTDDSTYTLPSAEKPLLVIFDKRNRLLKELNFDKSFEEWKYQAANAPNLVDRILAIRALCGKVREGNVTAILNDRMERDPFWGVRREAVTQAAQLASNSDSVAALVKPGFLLASKDIRAEVRTSAVRALQYYKGADIVAVLKGSLNDSSYSVISSALASYVKADSANALPTVRQFLTYPSHQDRVAAAALGAYASLDSTNAVTLACKRLGPGDNVGMRFTALNILRRYGRGRADALAALKDALGETTHMGVKYFAIQALGDIGDDSVVPALETITKDPDVQFSGVAKASIDKIKKRLGEKKD
ncbi:MAG TPA: M1 family metallopeptidase [Bacteroidota bacterium]